MKVSVITTCYNRAATIRGAVESVLAQDYGDVEYIIVDVFQRTGADFVYGDGIYVNAEDTGKVIRNCEKFLQKSCLFGNNILPLHSKLRYNE